MRQCCSRSLPHTQSWSQLQHFAGRLSATRQNVLLRKGQAGTGLQQPGLGHANFRSVLQQGKCAAAGKTGQQVMEQAVLLWHLARRPTHALVQNAVAQCRPYWGVLTSKTHCERLGAIAGVGHLKGHCGHQLALDNRDLGQLAWAQ